MPLLPRFWRVHHEKNAYPIQPVRTEQDYQNALSLVAPYFDTEPEPDSDAGAHFKAMVTLIEAYEAKHYPIAPPDPVQAIKFLMEQHDQTAIDFERLTQLQSFSQTTAQAYVREIRGTSRLLKANGES